MNALKSVARTQRGNEQNASETSKSQINVTSPPPPFIFSAFVLCHPHVNRIL